jgi:hypothetical protein
MLDPTQDQRELVIRLVRANVDHSVIAETLGITPQQLSASYPTELREATPHSIGKVADALYNKALEGNVAACKFFLETRAGWITKSDADTVKNKANPLTIILSQSEGTPDADSSSD